jgi:hypothetical protein
MKLTKILESVLDELNQPKPEDAYPFDEIKKKDTGYGFFYTYIYTNNKGDQMEITNMVTKLSTDPGKTLYVAFKKHDPADNESDEEQEKKYSEKTGANDAIKVLATVAEAVRQTFGKEGGQNNFYSIRYSPSDDKRKNIYSHYIETLFPDFEKVDSKIKTFINFVNKNFEKDTQ